MLPNEKGTVEDFIIGELVMLKWVYAEPQVMNDKRNGDFEQPIVVDDFKAALRKLNSCVELMDADLDFVLTSLKTIPTNVEGIRMFLDKFRNGFVVPLQKEGKERLLRIIDLNVVANNSFVVTRQFKIEGLKGNIRPDIVLLINGIPLVLIECKSPTAENVDWTDGYRQIKRYEEEAPELFKYVQFSIATDGMKTYYFPNAFTEEGKDKPNIWKDPYPKTPDALPKITHQNDLQNTIYGLLERHNLIDVVENFTFVKKEQDKSSKVMTRYMQFRAANRIYRRVFNTLTGAENSKFGLIWHWQGSGKTYAMAFAAWKLLNSPYTNKPSIFVLVDRKDLEEQIENDFSFIQVPLEKVESVKHLVEILKWGKEGKRGIFLVTIEKFRPQEFASLKEKTFEIERENVIVLADEVHRTQYGKFSTMMRSIFKNAFIFGFTGTPLSKMERNTFQKFCPTNELYLDRYSMLDALEDGFTVPLSYEARLPEYQLKERELKEFTKFEEDEIKTLSSEEQKAIRKKISVIKTYVKKPERISIIADDIATHFKDIVEPTGLKALLVTIDREACVLYKNALDKILPANYSEIVMTPVQNEKGIIKTYFERAKTQYATTDIKEMHRKIIENFKTRNEPKILIVTDMLITGFDAPNLWTMYLDKPLKEHRLLQAIARTNRPFQNKKWGLITDYIGILKELETAFERFEASDQKALRVVIRKLETEKEEFKKLLSEALKIFESVKRENTRESLEQTLNLLIDLDTANKFETTIKKLMKSYEMLRGDPFLRPYILDYTWLMKIYTAYYKRFRQARVDELKIGELSKKTLKLIQETIDVEELDNAFPTVTINEEFIENLKKQAPKTTGAPIDLFPPIIVVVRKHPNSLFFINLGKEVERTYEDLRAKKIETKEAIKKILDFSQRIVEWNKEETEIGIDKYPIYEAIKIILPEMEKQEVIAFINKLQTHLDQKGLLFKNWHEQRDVKRKVKDETRILLLSDFKENRSKVDDLRDAVVDALEKKQWTQ
jgi:type I restriction enzyme R subunit